MQEVAEGRAQDYKLRDTSPRTTLVLSAARYSGDYPACVRVSFIHWKQFPAASGGDDGYWLFLEYDTLLSEVKRKLKKKVLVVSERRM
jgi:hypothetical protein